MIRALALGVCFFSACATTGTVERWGPSGPSIVELHQLAARWRVAVDARQVEQAIDLYERWEMALKHVDGQVESHPDFSENVDAFERARPIDRRLQKHRAMRAEVPNMAALTEELDAAIQVALELARSFVDAPDRGRVYQELQDALVHVKSLRRRGQQFESYAPYREFVARLARGVRWVEEVLRTARWAGDVGRAVSTTILNGARASRAARRAIDPGDEQLAWVSASEQFAVCLSVLSRARRAGGYDPDFPLETPMGRVNLATVWASCQRAKAKSEQKQRRTRRRS